MILLVPGINSCTPLKEALVGVPNHVCDILLSKPDEYLELNKEMVNNSISLYSPSVVIGKSYGGWIAAEVTGKNTPLILFSLPLRDKKLIYGFPKIKNPAVNFFYSLQDPYFDKNLFEKNASHYGKPIYLTGDHSFRPITNQKLSKINKNILRMTKNKNFDSLLSDYFKKKENAKVKIVKKTPFYEEIPLEQIRKKIGSYLSFALNKKYGPITHVVRRKSPISDLYIYQSNILDTTAINPLLKDIAATSGIGVSYDEKMAINKSIYEALERYSLTLAFTDFVIKKYDDLPPSLKVEKKKLIFHNKIQKTKENLKDALKDKIHWTVIREIENNEEKLYPLQLIIPNNIGYMIRETTSSGTALGKNKEQALTHGLKEAIERNSLMKWYYNVPGIKSKKIKLKKSLVPKNFLKLYNFLTEKGFKFELYLIDFLGFNTLFILAHNKEELYMGSCCGKFKNSLESSLNEILITSFFAKTLKGITPKKPKEIKNLPQHFLYYQGNKKEKLIKYLDGLSKDKFKNNSSEIDYLKASRILKKNGYPVYYKDFTAPELKDKFYVGKIIIPGFLDIIKRGDLSWKSHYEIKKIPSLPTPFA